MTATAILEELRSLGTEQNRKIYRRHGVTTDQFGVSYANLGRLKKRIKTSHDLAQAIWDSGNHDARVLATMIADPKRSTEEMLDRWASETSNATLAGAVADLAAASPHARILAERWADSDDEWIGSAGWHVLARLAGHRNELPDEFFDRYLDRIERDIHAQKNRVREGMNNALIAIGVRNAALTGRSLAVAAAVGAVEIDHGQTNCKTPHAAQYIQKTLRHRQTRQPAAAT